MSIQNIMPGSNDERPSYRPPGDYRFDVALDGALQRHDFSCAACQEGLDAGEGVHRHIWYNDHSSRSGVPLCLDCANSDGWREDVKQNRLDDAGRLRGRVIETLWPYSTATVRFGVLALVEFFALVVLTIAVLVGGYTDTLATFVTTYPIGGAVGVAVAYLAHHALWVRLDPRGYAPPKRTPLGVLTFTTVAGVVGVILSTVVPNPLVWVGIAVFALATAREIGLVVRADRADTITTVPRELAVGGTRALTIVALVGMVAEAGTLFGAALATLPFVAAAAYLVYRAPKDSSLQRRLATAREELHDLVYGGPY
jgi:hypothetical protein